MSELELLNLARSTTEHEVTWFAQMITINFAMVVAITIFYRAQPHAETIHLLRLHRRDVSASRRDAGRSECERRRHRIDARTTHETSFATHRALSGGLRFLALAIDPDHFQPFRLVVVIRRFLPSLSVETTLEQT